jgi:hypothetical protein
MGLECDENSSAKPVNMDPSQVTNTEVEEDRISTAASGLVPDRDDVGARPITADDSKDDALRSGPFRDAVRVHNGEVLLNGDLVEDDVVPLKFKLDLAKSGEEETDPPRCRFYETPFRTKTFRTNFCPCKWIKKTSDKTIRMQ